ncbi:MAG: carboxymuconolactone decarboxylase family protein [Betaproteobacteria bacterium]|nr:carboxymuconolactone decarboxylase family protein [Betaproteobacteria bacterium]
MSRLNVVTPERATGPTKELYDAIKRAVGTVPNIYQGVGNSAAALEGVLQIGAVLGKGQLSAAEIEAIKLAVSEAYGCTYCLAAHTLLGKKAGLTDEQAISIRRGSPQQPKLGALVKFVNTAIQPKGRIADDDLRAVKTAGYNDAQITEALLTVAQTVFTNLFNRVHQTPLDFPAVPSL